MMGVKRTGVVAFLLILAISLLVATRSQPESRLFHYWFGVGLCAWGALFIVVIPIIRRVRELGLALGSVLVGFGSLLLGCAFIFDSVDSSLATYTNTCTLVGAALVFLGIATAGAGSKPVSKK